MDKRKDQSPPDITDAELETYLDGQSEVSSVYRSQAQAEPAPALDRQILAAAETELKSARSSGTNFWQQWLRPISTVAVMGLCLVLVLQVVSNAPPLPGEQADLAALQPAAPQLADVSAGRMGQERTESAGLDDRPRENRQTENRSTEDRSIEDRLMESPKTDIRRNDQDDAQEIVVMARKSEASLQEVPVAASASLDEMVVSFGPSIPEDIELTDNALEAWQSGVMPAPDVWLAGIRLWEADLEPELIAAELAKLQRAYPDFSIEEKEQENAQVARNQQAANAGSVTGYTVQQNATASSADIASDWAWIAGIERLYENGADERADSEAARFEAIYRDAE